ncbi:MAG: sporulation initiation factor Spo0A C-terminal domain-containing protein [Clostridia bacterium]
MFDTNASDALITAQNILFRFGFHPLFRGTLYLSEALILIHNDPSAPYSVMDKIYKPLAKRHGKSLGSIETNMRRALADAYTNGNKKMFAHLIHRSTGQPTVSEFLLLLYQQMLFDQRYRQ